MQQIKKALRWYFLQFNTDKWKPDTVDCSDIAWGIVLFPCWLVLTTIAFLIAFPLKLLANWLNK